jgi:WD40 repeat protein
VRAGDWIVFCEIRCLEVIKGLVGLDNYSFWHTFSIQQDFVLSTLDSQSPWCCFPGAILAARPPVVRREVLLQGHTLSVYSVAFAPDGQTLASGSGDGTVRLWGVP